MTTEDVRKVVTKHGAGKQWGGENSKFLPTKVHIYTSLSSI